MGFKQYMVQLHATKRDLESKRQALLTQSGNVAAQLANTEAELKSIQKRILREENPAPKALQISDHAVLRYLMRAKGVDVDGARLEMLADIQATDREAAIAKGYIFESNTCVTYKGKAVENKPKPKPAPLSWWKRFLKRGKA